jgi:S-DNA-T family DNA segregation ATPase FtsK/SpoIIIE
MTVYIPEALSYEPDANEHAPAAPSVATPVSVPVASMLSIYDPVFVGIDEFAHPVYLPAIYHNVLLGGLPGAGKSSHLSNFVAHAALSADCRLCLLDGKQVELCLWEDCADVFVGPDQAHAIRTLIRLQTVMDNRYTFLRQCRRRKIVRDDDMQVILVVIDEIAYFSATVGDKKTQDHFAALLRDLVARGRAVGIIVVAATQRPSSDIIPTSLRDLFAWRVAGYCTTDASSDIVLGHGWASLGFSANKLLSATNPGSCLLISETGQPRKIKGAYLTDTDIITVADHAAATRRAHRELVTS